MADSLQDWLRWAFRTDGKVLPSFQWRTFHGSALDKSFLSSLGSFDIVYSWGVLHHSGHMWEAMENILPSVAPGGKLFIALYSWHTGWYEELRVKEKWKSLKAEEDRRVFFKNMNDGVSHDELSSEPMKGARGMNRRSNAMDWLGGYPYETARSADVARFLRNTGQFVPARELIYDSRGMCNVYLYRKVPLAFVD
eukprot:gnl/MRDRNA2_/MRDRNA2_429666_c0_seq1.p1 gnl/MRDRNA2_/MRDRNA2_429666_c0~~gnl/MRDRNA2_/MRDRNA2_429666_c0_seq1.p1  ORF type:complete len:202 (-),score=25.29 gnl/MRDRNA2_/MRDRNA2_429666_c0_seq1:5-589(-)